MKTIRLLLLRLLLLAASMFCGCAKEEEATTTKTTTTKTFPAENLTTDSTTSSTDPCEGRLALVTGATGRVGSMVTHRLLEKGYCVRILTRNATKAQENLGSPLNLEVAVGQLGDGSSVARAFQPKNGGATISHVVFTAGGEEADFDAVNHRGLVECAEEAVKAGSQSLVVISAAWVSKPYSLASLLFNLLYANLPMARHLQGEDALRLAAATKSDMNYVILRAGRLVPDEEYPKDAAMGLMYEQGDSFFFFGPAGMPGMCNTQLADAVLTALEVKGKYTVEVTGGTVDSGDASIYAGFLEDDVLQITSSEDVLKCHQEAIWVFQVGGIALVILIVAMSMLWRRSFCFSLAWIVVSITVFVLLWTKLLSGISVLECTNRGLGKSTEL